MKVFLAFATILLACAAAFGQSTRSQYQDAEPGGGAPPGMQRGPGPGAYNEARRQEQQMQEQIRQMQGDLQDLQTRLTKLRADANQVRDPDTRAALLDIAEIWEQSAQRMQSSLQQMRTMMRGGGTPRGGAPGQ